MHVVHFRYLRTKRMPSNARKVLYIITHASYVTTAIAYAINQVDKQSYKMTEPLPIVNVNPDVAVSFSHFHLYVDKVDELAMYRSLENKLNIFDASLSANAPLPSVEEKKQLWRSLGSAEGMNRDEDEPRFIPQNRDIIRQLIAGLGFRVTGYADHSTTRTVLLSSRDPDGVQIVISAMKHTTGKDNSRIAPPPTTSSNQNICDYGES